MGMLAYFVNGFFYMVGLRLCDSLSRSCHFWGVCDSSRCYSPVPFLCGSTNSCSIIYDHVFGYLIVSSRGMKAVFGIGSGPSKFYLNDDGASMIVRGIAAPSIFSQTIRYSKVSLDLAKKSTLYGKKNRSF